MQISWGTKIAALYIGFVCLIIGLVTATFWHPSQLVTKDYYQQELSYNQRMQEQQAAAKLSERLKVELGTDNLQLQFPAEFKDQKIDGQIYFYSVADVKRDRHFPVQQLMGGNWQIARAEIPKGKYKVQVEWTAAGNSYFETQDVQLN